jgi:UDP-N-acetylmuramate-alanine ligase
MDGDEPAYEVSDKGKKVYIERNLGYYRNLAQAFQAIAWDMLQNGAGSIMTVDDYAERAETIEATLEAANE